MILESCNISVIICAYTEERWDDLVSAVESLRVQTQRPDEIIIVIDHNILLFARVKADIPGVIVIENSASRGLSGARNTGLSIAHGSFIAFLDDDAEAEPGWLELLVHCCEDPQVLGAGGTVVPLWQGKQPSWFPTEFYWVIGCTYQMVPERPIVVRNPYGGCTCIKREVFQAIGGFREGIGRVGADSKGGEETELSIRATQFWPKKVFLYEPNARIHHHIPIQRTQWSYFITRCYAEGLSKALVSRYVGTRDSLSSERDYTLKTLPQGVIRNLSNAFFHRNPSGILKAGAILVGLFVTTSGYLVGRLFTWKPKSKKHGYERVIDGRQLIPSVYSISENLEDIYPYDKESLPR